MSGLLEVVGSSINYLIGLCGIAILVWMLLNASKLSSHRSLVEAALTMTNIKTIYNTQLHAFENDTQKEQVTPDTMREYEKTFNELSVTHATIASLIPVFPLLGILGTVVGLMQQSQGLSDVNVVIAGLDTALTSTFFGLIASIVLKLVDTFLPAKMISETELIFENYDKKLNTAIMLGNVSSSEEESK